MQQHAFKKMVLSVGTWFKQNWFCTCSSKAAMILPSARDITSVYILHEQIVIAVCTRSIILLTIANHVVLQTQTSCATNCSSLQKLLAIEKTVLSK